MATSKKTARSTGARDMTAKQIGAIELLTADHDKVKTLFKEFEQLHADGEDGEAEEIARTICQELTIHATIEEEIFYPEVRDAIDDEDLMNEAEVEHESAKDLIAEIEDSDTSDEKYAARVIVLGEYVAHHVKEEEDEMFAKAKKAKLDMEALGERLMERKQELKAEMVIADDEEEASA